MKPYSESCEQNREPILKVLHAELAGHSRLLEIGSGTGQHACHFAANMPWLRWQSTELMHNLPVLQPRCDLYAADNLLTPRALDVRDDNDHQVRDRFFSIREGALVAARPFMPSMFTLDERIIRQDCLGYLMERLLPE